MMLNSKSRFLSLCIEVDDLKQKFMDFTLPSLKSGTYSNLPVDEEINEISSVDKQIGVAMYHLTSTNQVDTKNETKSASMSHSAKESEIKKIGDDSSLDSAEPETEECQDPSNLARLVINTYSNVL